MNSKVIAVITAVVVVVAAIGAVLYSRNNVSQNASVAPTKVDLKPGDIAPPFQVSSTAGYFDSSAVHAPILLEVFATWCIHCQHETAILDDIQAKYGNQIKLIAVNGSAYADAQNDPETQAHVVEFAQAFKVLYPIAFDPDLTVAGKYLGGGFPTIVIIDHNGRIASVSTGEATEPDLIKRIKPVI